MIDGRGFLSEGPFVVALPFLSPCSEPTRLVLISSTSGRHFSSISLATGASKPESPETEISELRKGRISGIYGGIGEGKGVIDGVKVLGGVNVTEGVNVADAVCVFVAVGEDVNVGELVSV